MKQIWKSSLTKFLKQLSNFLNIFRNFFHMFLRPQCTFGTKKSKKSNTGTPSKLVLFQKTWWKRVKEYSFNFFPERGIVEDCIPVILPPQLTLSDWFCIFSNFFPELTLLSQNSNSGVLGVYWAYIWLQFIKWNAKALTHVVRGVDHHMNYSFQTFVDKSNRLKSWRIYLAKFICPDC